MVLYKLFFNLYYFTVFFLSTVTLYSCGSLGTNCAQCLSVSSDFHCAACSSHFPCVLETQCNNNIISDIRGCPLPDILSVRLSTSHHFSFTDLLSYFMQVTPGSGPTSGGTVVTVRGTNLGMNHSQVSNVIIGETACEVLNSTYKPGLRYTRKLL